MIFETSISLQDIQNIVVKTDIYNVYLSQNDQPELKIKIECDKPIKITEKMIQGCTTIDKSLQTLYWRFCAADLKEKEVTKADIYLRLPESVRLEVESDSSHIYGANFDFDILLNTIKGSIELEKIEKSKIISEATDIKLKNVFGNFEVETKTGEINVSHGLGGVMTLSAEDSFIDLTDVSFNYLQCSNRLGYTKIELNEGKADNLEAFSEKGHISFSIANNTSGTVLLKSSFGDIDIFSPKDLLLNYDLETINGEVTTNIETEKAYEILLDNNRFCVSFDSDITTIKAQSKEGNLRVHENIKGIQGECFEEKRKRKAAQTLQDKDNADQIIDLENEILIKDTETLKQKGKYDKISADKNKNNAETIVIPKTINIQTIKKGIYKGISVLTHKNPKKPETENPAILKILEMVESGMISVDDAQKLIKALPNQE